MKYLLLLLPFSLCSCPSMELFQNDYIEAEVGYYKKSAPLESGSKFGAFITRPAPAIDPAK